MTQTNQSSAMPAGEQVTASGVGEMSRPVEEELTALRAIVDAASYGSGEEYFQALVRALARVVDTRWAFIAKFSSPETHTKARTIAFWDRDRIVENFEWTLAGTPCEDVVHGKLCHHASGVRQKFPDDPYPRSGESKVFWEYRCAIPKERFSATSQPSTTVRCRRSRGSCSLFASSRSMPPLN